MTVYTPEWFAARYAELEAQREALLAPLSHIDRTIAEALMKADGEHLRSVLADFSTALNS